MRESEMKDINRDSFLSAANRCLEMEISVNTIFLLLSLSLYFNPDDNDDNKLTRKRIDAAIHTLPC